MQNPRQARAQALLHRLLQIDAQAFPAHAQEFLRSLIEELTQFIEDLNNKKIGIAGSISSGKSTLINRLLGVPIVSCGGGETTAVAIELVSSPRNDFRATVHFLSIEDFIGFIIYYVLHREENNEDDLKLHAIMARLRATFDLQSDADQPQPHAADAELLDGQRGVDLIGASPVEIFANSVEDLRKQLAKYTKVRNDRPYSLSLFVDRVVIEGPFRGDDGTLRLPAGVTIVDTPGLGSARVVNSQVAIDSAPAFDELWVTTTRENQLSNRVDRQYIHNFAVLRSRPLRIVVTRCDIPLEGTCDGSDDESDPPGKVRANLKSELPAGYIDSGCLNAPLRKNAAAAPPLTTYAVDMVGMPGASEPVQGFESIRAHMQQLREEQEQVA